MKKKFFLKRAWGATLSFIGFILSPLTWWNDLFINLPLAFGFAFIVGWIYSLFVPVTVVFFLILITIGYILTNLLGFVLMGKGMAKMYKPKKVKSFSLKRSVIYSLLALFFVLLSIQVGLLDLTETDKLFSSVLKIGYLEYIE